MSINPRAWCKQAEAISIFFCEIKLRCCERSADCALCERVSVALGVEISTKHLTSQA